MCCGQFFEVNWTLQYQCFLCHGQRQFSKSQNFNHGVCLFTRYPNEIWHACCTKTVKPAGQISGEILNSYRFIATWSVQQLLASLCRQPAPVCPAIDEIRYNSTGNPWQSERLLEIHQNQANVFKSIRVSTEFPKWNSSTFPGLFKHLNGKIQALPCIDFIVPAFNWNQILAGTRIF